MAVRNTALEAGLVALPASTLSLSEPWFSYLHFGIIISVSEVS